MALQADLKRSSTETCVIALYSDDVSLKRALAALSDGGIHKSQISIATKSNGYDEELHSYLAIGADGTEKGAVIGAGSGTLIGMILGAAFFWAPGLGALLIAGPLAGGLTGGIVGGLLGAMSHWGVPDDRVAIYESKLREGKRLIMVHANPLMAEDAYTILQTTTPDELHLHANSSDDSPDIRDDRPELHS